MLTLDTGMFLWSLNPRLVWHHRVGRMWDIKFQIY